MGELKTFKRGQQIYKEGEKSASAYLIQSGMVSVYLPKQKKNIELYRLTGGQVLAEEALYNLPLTASAVAINDVTVIELRVDATRQLIDSTNPQLRAIVKALCDKQKVVNGELKTLRAEQDTSPCPPDAVAKVFGVLYHVVNYTGTKKDNKATISWANLKRYAHRVFLESPIRLEQAFNVLVKLKLAEVQMIKSETDENAPDEMGTCTFHDLAMVERFFEYFQNFHFKGGNANLLKYDEKCTQTAQALVKVSEGEKTDRNGVVYLNYKTVCDRLKAMLGPSFNPDAILRLEQKGLFVKRESNDRGGQLSFFRSEFISMLDNWKFLREIEKWNDLGFVDLKEGQASPTAADAQKEILTCPTCLSQITEAMRFCPACGANLAQKAAA